MVQLWKFLLWVMVGVALVASAAAEYRIIDGSTDERCDAHACSRIITSYNRWTADGRNASDALSISYAGGLLNYSCTDYWAAFQVRVHTPTGNYPLQNVLASYPAIRDSVVKSREDYGVKYGIHLQNLSAAAQSAFLALELRLADSRGITYAEIERDGYDLIGRECRLSFADLVENNFSVTMNRTSILIGNVSGKAELWLDPTVTLGNETSVFQEDTRVSDDQPNTNFGNSPTLTASNATRTAIFLNYTHLNLTNASNAVMYLSRGDSTGNFSVTARMRRCNQSFFEENVLTQNNFSTFLTDCEAGNASEASGNIGDWFQFNITDSITAQLDGQIGFVLNYTNSTASVDNCENFPWCIVDWASTENTNASRRPYLNITYYRNIPPTAAAAILPAAPTEEDSLTCNHTYTDTEGDAEGSTAFRWVKDGALIAGQTGETLPSSAFGWGDDMLCQVRPHDGFDFGEWANSSQITILPAGSTGGGGGGTLIVVSPESQIAIDWGRSQYSFSVFAAPSRSREVFPLVNRGQRNLHGSVRMLGNLSQYVRAEICELDGGSCSENQVSLAAGETALLQLSGDFPRGWGPQTEGVVRLRDGFTEEISDLVVVADRPPLAFFAPLGVELGYVRFSQRFELSESSALFAYLAVLGLGLVAVGGAI